MRRQARKGFDQLYPFGRLFVRFEDEVRQRLSELTSQQLEAVIKECKQATDSNCWWAIHRVAPLVRRLAEERLAALSAMESGKYEG